MELRRSIISTLFYSFLLYFSFFSFGVFIEQNKHQEKLKKIDSYGLTPKEKEVAKLILSKKKNKEIACELYVELSTIKTHINSIYKKLEVSSRKELTDKLS